MIWQHELTKKLNFYNNSWRYCYFSFLTFCTSIDQSKAKLDQNAIKIIRYFHEYQLIVNTLKI